MVGIAKSGIIIITILHADNKWFKFCCLIREPID